MNEIDKQVAKQHRGNPAWVKGGTSPNPKGRPKKEHTLRDILHEIGQQRAKGLSKEEIAELRRMGYKATWTNEQVLGAQQWVSALKKNEFSVSKIFDYGVGRPVPLTDMPTVIVNQQTVVEQKQEASIDKLAAAFKAMVAAGIVPAEMFAGYAVTQGNGHVPEDDE